MRVEKYKGVAEASDNFSVHSRSYRVDSPQLVFDLLCNKMYSRPLYTMIQEYMANARDAHREINKHDIPINIVTPTIFDDYLYIQDFGPGLSDQRIDDVFVSLGASTKSDSDEMTGGFGLGAKIGWAYGDSFTIISVVDGLKSTYLAYLDETGIGKMDTLSSESTEDENGVTIKIKIKDKDKDKIIPIIEQITYFWGVAPTCNEHIRHYDKKVHDDFLLTKVPFAELGTFVVVDGIIYTLQTEHVPTFPSLSSRYFDRASIFLFFDVSEIDVAVNREGLRYSPRTIDAISYVVKKIVDRVYTDLERATYTPNYDDKVALFNKCYTHIGAPKLITVKIQEYIYLSFSYKNPEGRLSIYSAYDGARTSVYGVRYTSTGKGLTTRYDSDTKNISVSNEGTILSDNRTYTYTVPLKSNSPRYILLTSETEFSKAINKEFDRLRTIVNRNSDFNVIVTENKKMYDFLITHADYVCLSNVVPTVLVSKNGGISRACNFDERDVKLISDRNKTIDIDALDPEKDMWCTFKEKKQVLSLLDKYSINSTCNSFTQSKCYYLTAVQIEYVKMKEIPHYTEVLKKSYNAILNVAYNKHKIFFSKTKSMLTYGSDGGTIRRILLANKDKFSKSHDVHEFLECMARRNYVIDQEDVLHALQNNIASTAPIVKGHKYKYRLIKKNKTMYRSVVAQCDEVIEAFNKKYALMSVFYDIPYRYTKRKDIEEHIVNYINSIK